METVEYMWVDIRFILIVPTKMLECEGASHQHQLVSSSEIVKFLLKTNDGRGGRLGWATLSATYASAKTREHKGSI